MKQAKVLFDRHFQIGQIDKRLMGSFAEHLGRCVYSGIYEPQNSYSDQNGFRNDVKKLTKELGVSLIRYPGGNFVSGYHWKDGVGPKEQRPARLELAWNVVETNEVGTDEFAAYLKEIEVELMMAVNLATGTPTEAGELVEYCNVEKGTFWSDQRRKNASEQPYQIKLWCLGNEMDGEWQIGSHTAQEYARKAKETAKIMKWVDPEIELVACGTCTNEEGHLSFGDWDRIVLEETYDVIDYLSLHRYFNYHSDKQLFYPMRDNMSDIPFFFTDLKNYLDTVIAAIDFVKGKRKSEKTVNISFDEWGVVTESGAIPGGVQQEYGYASFRLLDAVIYGGLLCTFLNYADRVKIACQSLLVNEGGMISTNPKGEAIRQVTFYPFQDVARYGKGVSLKPVVQLPFLRTEHHGEQPCMTVAAAFSEQTGELNLFFMNCDLTEEIEVEIQLNSFGKLEGVVWRELYHSDVFARNDFGAENKVKPKEKTLQTPVDGSLTVILKKHSWNVLCFRVLKA